MENTIPTKYSEIKHRIKRSQAQAKTLGFFYLLGVLAITVLACLPLAKVREVTLGVAGFWQPFTKLFEKGGTMVELLKANVIGVSIAVLYTCMLLGLLVNVLASFAKLSWLFKRNASKLYGFNRNMYAMEALAKLFSRTFNCVICFHLLIALVAGGMQLTVLSYVTLGVGLVWHLVLTPIAGNVSLYTTEDGIREEKRQVGNFTPIVRNVLQLGVTGVILYWFVRNIGKLCLVKSFIVDLTTNGVKAITADPKLILVPVLSIVLTVLIMCMCAYALGIKEFDSEGAKERGRKGFLWISLFTFIIAVAIYVVGLLFAKHQLTRELIYIALVSLAMFVVEILLRKYPKFPSVNKDEVSVEKYLTDDEKNYGMQGFQPMPFFPYPYMPYAPYWVEQNPQNKNQNK